MKENYIAYFIILTSLVFLLLAFSAIALLQLFKRKQKFHCATINSLKIQFENDKLKAQLQVQETTFQHISREIHDNVGQKLSFAKLQLNTIVSDDNAIIANVVQIITDSLNDLRDVSRSLSGEFIAGNGFLKILENEIEQLNRSGLYRFKLVVVGEQRFLKSEKEVILFRIVQEALNNIIKHAEATEIIIRIHYMEHQLSIEVHDNGKGFDAHEVADSNGILNIKGRAKLLNGTTHYQSEIGKGTTLNLNIPINESTTDQNHDG